MREREKESSERECRGRRGETMRQRGGRDERRKRHVVRPSSPLENYPSRATLQVFTPPFSSEEPQRAPSRELDVMVARGKCLNFSLSKISR